MIIMKGLECRLLVPNERENTRPEGFSIGKLDGIYLMIIMKGLECSLLVPNERENTRPERLQVLEDWHRHLTAFHVHPEIPVVLISHQKLINYMVFQ
jgi:hypothetical protein